jgi:hypothetical protein
MFQKKLSDGTIEYSSADLGAIRFSGFKDEDFVLAASLPILLHKDSRDGSRIHRVIAEQHGQNNVRILLLVDQHTRSGDPTILIQTKYTTDHLPYRLSSGELELIDTFSNLELFR